jgi:hypothetical protein
MIKKKKDIRNARRPGRRRDGLLLLRNSVSFIAKKKKKKKIKASLSRGPSLTSYR